MVVGLEKKAVLTVCSFIKGAALKTDPFRAGLDSGRDGDRLSVSVGWTTQMDTSDDDDIVHDHSVVPSPSPLQPNSSPSRVLAASCSVVLVIDIGIPQPLQSVCHSVLEFKEVHNSTVGTLTQTYFVRCITLSY
jgi:hypothetical protein